MSITPEEARTGHPQGGDGAVASARAEREARLASDEAQMREGPSPQHEPLDHHQGMPTVETQMKTHGQAPPHVPDTGGHG